MAAAADTTGRLPTCPNCGSKATAQGQLMCLECGARMGVVFRRAASWTAPLAIVLAVAAVLAILAVLAFAAIKNRADDEVGSATHYASATVGHVAPT